VSTTAPSDAESTAEESLSILGYVIIVTPLIGNLYLTNADLMDLEAAEHEAAEYRRQAEAQGSKRRFQVRPIWGAK
jgi:hypothetical protein